MQGSSLSISTAGLSDGHCVKCGESSVCVDYALNGHASTAQIGDGILSCSLSGVSIHLRLLLCKRCLVAIVSERFLILEG